MKNQLVMLICLCSTVLYAQDEKPKGRNFEKGTYKLGVNGSGSYGNGSLSKSSAVSLTTWVGYFPLRNMAAGVRVSHGRDVFKVKDSSVPYQNHRITSIAPELFLRYYAPKIKVKPFLQVGLGYNFQQGDGVKASNGIGSVEGGVAFPLGKRLGLDVSYQWRAWGASKMMDANDKTNLRLGLSFRL